MPIYTQTTFQNRAVKSWGNQKISQRTYSICGSRPKCYVLAKMLTFSKLCWHSPHPRGKLNKENLEPKSSWPQKLVRCGQGHLKFVLKSILQWRFYPGKSFLPAVSLFQWSSTPSSSICRRSLFLIRIVLGSFLKFKLQSTRTLRELINFPKIFLK